MAEVAVVFKVMPKDTEVDLGVLEKDIKGAIGAEKIEREPIAFGLVALKVTKLIPDAAGFLEETEKRIRSVKDVSEVEVVEMGRTL